MSRGGSDGHFERCACKKQGHQPSDRRDKEYSVCLYMDIWGFQHKPGSATSAVFPNPWQRTGPLTEAVWDPNRLLGVALPEDRASLTSVMQAITFMVLATSVLFTRYFCQFHCVSLNIFALKENFVLSSME